ncbi:MAG: ATP-binding protein [Planctomycetes bacterium]|nr:ATP-binding protein [Planctomycetota bacterium]
MDLQELVFRGRFIFSSAPLRLEVFSLVNGRRSAKEIGIKTGKSASATLNDLKKIAEMELINTRTGSDGKIVRKDGSVIYEKVPLARSIPLSYFSDTTKSRKKPSKKHRKGVPSSKKVSRLRVPSENEILDICKHGESQLHEFKASGVEARKITREIGAFLNTKRGGIIFYGVEDDGSIAGTDIHRQQFDQSIQNSILNNIDPAAIVDIRKAVVLGTEILIIIVPAWDNSTVYQYDGRTLLRKGTNVFVAKTEEVRKLHSGVSII